MSVTLASATTAKYVTDSVPGIEPLYRARFYLDPNSITMANNAYHVIFYGDSGTTAVLQVDLGYTTAGGYRLRVRIRDNSSLWNNSSWVNIPDAPHVIELDWRQGNPGSLAWWIDEAAQPAPNGLDNSGRAIDRIRLGAVANVDATTNGTFYIDAFESHRQSAIGPMRGPLTSTFIAYTYDPLYRLTAAEYEGGADFFRYTYDAVGNRLTSVGGVTYTWSNNGNLLSDGVSTYTYDHANQLATSVQGGTTYTFAYSGLGDRLRQTMNGMPTSYTLDLAAGLTEVLYDGANAYFYGAGRIGEEQPGGWAYHLGDALGSVRQLAGTSAHVTLARGFEPFGDPLASLGAGTSIFQFASQLGDASRLLDRMARSHSSAVGRLLSRVYRASGSRADRAGE